MQQTRRRLRQELSHPQHEGVAKAVCLRLSGKGGEVSSIIPLGTQYVGGKTHSLIALVHAVRSAAIDFEALERLPKLTFAETVPTTKIPERIPPVLSETDEQNDDE